jgi:hypothetical protein
MIKKILIVLGIIIGLIILITAGFGVYLKVFKSQKVVSEYFINGEKADSKKVLIVTQKSAFKDSVMTKVAEYFKDKNITIRVKDATNLETADAKDVSCVVVFTTVEAGKLLDKVTEFLKIQKGNKNIFVMNISGGGKWNNTTDFDSYASASETNKTGLIAGKIIEKINSIIGGQS